MFARIEKYCAWCCDPWRSRSIRRQTDHDFVVRLRKKSSIESILILLSVLVFLWIRHLETHTLAQTSHRKIIATCHPKRSFSDRSCRRIEQFPPPCPLLLSALGLSLEQRSSQYDISHDCLVILMCHVYILILS